MKLRANHAEQNLVSIGKERDSLQAELAALKLVGAGWAQTLTQLEQELSATIDQRDNLNIEGVKDEQRIRYAKDQLSLVVTTLNVALNMRPRQKELGDGGALEALCGMLHEWEHWLVVDWEEFTRVHNGPPSTPPKEMTDAT